MDLLEHLLTRRSVKAAELSEPGPNDQQLKEILTAAMRVPDHGKLAPWRIKVLNKEGQAKLGEVFAEAFVAANPDANDKQIAFERARPQQSPLLIAVLYTPVLGRIPEWEQELSTGAMCMNLIHAAYAQGFAAQWLTEWPAFSPDVKYALGGTLEDKIAGFIYIGSSHAVPDDRPRPNYDEVVSEWSG